jgi:Fur family transcriptional regulator, ferric uptake regulator
MTEGKTVPQRSTRQRTAVARSLSRTDVFRSAQDIYDSLRSEGVSIGLTTVYRTLQSMSDAGELDVLRSEDGEALYRRCALENHHHHLVCRSCGWTVEIESEEIERWTERSARRHGFSEIAHEIEIFGLCGPCSAQ